MMEGNVSRTTSQRSAARPQPRSGSGGSAVAGTVQPAVDHGRIAERAYQLYEQRGRQDGRALEDWLNAERQLTAAPMR